MLFQKNKFLILLLLFFSAQLLLVQKNQYQLAIFVYFLFVIVLRYFDKKLVVSFFVFYLPLLPIVTTDYKLLGVIGPHEIIYGFSFYYLWDLDRKKLNRSKLNDYQKLSIAFAYFLGLSELYILIKDVLVGLETQPNMIIYFFKVIVRLFLYYGSIILLIRNIYLQDFKQTILQGIKYSILALTISMIFTKELIKMGAGIAIKKDRLERILSGEYQRYLGWYNAGGDENSLGIFMVAAFGFFLAIYEKDRKIKDVIVYMGSAILGSLLTGSRTAFLALVAVFSIFIFTNKSIKSKFALFIATIAFYFLFYDRLQLVIERFYDPSAGDALDPEEEGRVGKWLKYISWIANNPETLFFGNLSRINYNQAPHNYFVYLLYHGGIIIFSIFLRKFISLIYMMKITPKSFELKNAYYIIPFPFIVMTVNSFGSSIYLWLFLPLGAYFNQQLVLKLNP